MIVVGVNNEKIRDEIVKQIPSLYSELKSTRKVGEVLGISKTAVTKYLKQYGVELETNKKTSKQIAEIKRLYEKYNNVEAVARVTGYKWSTVKDYLGGYDTPKRRKYSYKDDIFKTINSEHHAYWLGFLYADGCVVDCKGYPCRVSFYIQPRDEAHCFKFIDFIQGDKALFSQRNDGYVGVDINNKEVATSLTKLGMTPRKSLTLTYPSPTILPDKHTRHFIRGYFDGDGTAYYRKNGQPVAGFVGTRDMMRNILDVLVMEVGIHDNVLYERMHNVCEFKHQGSQAVRVLEYMYKDSNVYLDRKHQIYAALS